MPKIKVISRTEKSMGRDTKDQMMKIRRSTNQLIHPFQKVKPIKKSQNSLKSPNPQKTLKKPSQSACVIALCMQRDPEESVPEWEEQAALAMAVQNMWLCCTEFGIGSYWSSPGLITYMDEFFDLNEGEKCLGFFYMGYYDDEVNTSARTSIEEKVEWFD